MLEDLNLLSCNSRDRLTGKPLHEALAYFLVLIVHEPLPWSCAY
jgi:hypothetical protein